MSLWWWLLIGFAAWFAPAVLVGLMLGRVLLRRPRAAAEPVRPHQQLLEGQPPLEGQPHSGA